MDSASLIARMEPFPDAIGLLIGNLAAADARWKPPSGAWSILEIVCHLASEEVEDFRARLESTLRDPADPWPGIDPEGWIIERKFNDRDLAESLAQFAAARAESIAWLREVAPKADWSKTFEHPKIGRISAGDLLASWAAHDALHLRQISKRLFELTHRDGEGFNTRYAGQWGS